MYKNEKTKIILSRFLRFVKPNYLSVLYQFHSTLNGKTAQIAGNTAMLRWMAILIIWPAPFVYFSITLFKKFTAT